MAALGELLQHAREERGISLEEAERVTHIARRYLIALEAEDYSAFPAAVFGRGFLRNYSQYLGLNANDMLAMWPADGMQAAATHDAIAADASARGLRFPWRGRTGQDDSDVDEQAAAGNKPRLPRRTPTRQPDEPRQTQPAWRPLRAARQRTIAAPGPLTVGSKPPYGSSPSGRTTALLLWLAPLVALLVLAFVVSRGGAASKTAANPGLPTGSANASAPNGSSHSAGSMPRLVGTDGQSAVQKLRALGVEPLVLSVSGGTATPGSVLQQDPAAGASIRTNTPVTLIVESGGVNAPVVPSAAPSVRPSGTAAPGRAAPSASAPAAAPTVRATPRVP